MYLFIIILVIVHLYFSVKKPLYGICTLLAIKILIPDTARSPISVLSLNSLCSLILFASYIIHLLSGKEKYRYINNHLVHYIGIYFIFSLLVIVFTDYTPRSSQINTLIQYFALQLLPVIVAIGTIHTTKDLKLVLYVFVICMAICTLYGLTCLVFRIPYPYNAWFAESFSVARNANYEGAVESVAGGVQGRIIGTATSDTWSFGMFISLAFMISYFVNKYLKSNYSLICYVLCAIAVVLTVRRAPVLTLLSFYFLLSILYYKLSFKIYVYVFVGIITLYMVIILIPELASFRHIVESSVFFWDDSVAHENGVTGSSLKLRLYQLNYTVTNISESPLLGNGWGAQYAKYHPGMYGWESIIFTSLFQSGYLGIIALTYLFVSFYKYSIKNAKNRGIALSFILSSALFCITSDTIYPFFIYFGCVLLNKMNNCTDFVFAIHGIGLKELIKLRDKHQRGTIQKAIYSIISK